MATALVLCVATGVTLSAAAPALLRAAGLDVGGRSPLTHGDDHAVPPHPTMDARERRFIFAPDDDDDPHLTELERLIPDGVSRGQREGDRARERGSRPYEGPSLLTVRRPLTLRSHPGRDGVVLGTVKAGDQVVIITSSEDWVYVFHNHDGKRTSGWAAKSEIAVR